MKFCLIGCGNIAETMHAPSYMKYKAEHPEFQMAACCDPIEERAKAMQRQVGFERCYTNHQEMIRKARKLMQSKIKTEPVGFKLLPKLFTLTQLQRLYEAVNGEEIDKRNFRKRIKEMEFIEKTELIDKLTSKRGAFLYRFNKKAYEEDKNFKL